MGAGRALFGIGVHVARGVRVGRKAPGGPGPPVGWAWWRPAAARSVWGAGPAGHSLRRGWHSRRVGRETQPWASRATGVAQHDGSESVSGQG